MTQLDLIEGRRAVGFGEIDPVTFVRQPQCESVAEITGADAEVVSEIVERARVLMALRIRAPPPDPPAEALRRPMSTLVSTNARPIQLR